ncbi:MAG: chorismate-binding protein [Nonlabens sp.]
MLFKHIIDALENNLPCFSFKKSNTSRLQVLVQNNKTLYNTPPIDLDYAVMVSFDSSSKIYIVGDQFYNEMIDVENIASSSADFVEESLETGEYLSLVENAINAIERKEMVKVVLSRKRNFKTTLSKLQIFKNLLKRCPEANCYFFYHPDVGCWMGASPEILLEYDKGTALTVSLAGTAQSGVKQPIWSDKEYEEQQIVTDYIANQLSKFSSDEIKITSPTTIKAGSLLHLKSTLTGEVSKGLIADLLSHLHPTPAVCGIPVPSAKKFIKDKEGYNREFYTGYFGIVNQEAGTQDYYVNLRCLQSIENAVEVYVGGGIVAASNPEKELLETIAKENTMRAIL